MSTAGTGTSTTSETSGAIQAASRLGQLVSGRYRIEKLLGEGGMGAIAEIEKRTPAPESPKR